MLLLIFTLDYEIFGNGEGRLKDLVYEPVVKLNSLFDAYDVKYVNFVEAAELIKIKEYGTDNYIDLVENQLAAMHNSNYEIALHIHPQWFNGKFINNKWSLDYNEYNLSRLDTEKIDSYINLCVEYLKRAVKDESFSPISYRAGGWLIQPSYNISKNLRRNGIIIESSVFKGGYNNYVGLDFRKYPVNKFFWSFSSDVLEEDTEGKLLEIPIYSQMFPIWKMYSKKRVGIHKNMRKRKDLKYKIFSYLDKIRFKYPQKYDFAKMTFTELKNMLDKLIMIDSDSKDIVKPIVLIGHSKNLIDLNTIEKFLKYVKNNKISITTFKDFNNNLHKLKNEKLIS